MKKWLWLLIVLPYLTNCSTPKTNHQPTRMTANTGDRTMESVCREFELHWRGANQPVVDYCIKIASEGTFEPHAVAYCRNVGFYWPDKFTDCIRTIRDKKFQTEAVLHCQTIGLITQGQDSIHCIERIARGEDSPGAAYESNFLRSCLASKRKGQTLHPQCPSYRWTQQDFY